MFCKQNKQGIKDKDRGSNVVKKKNVCVMLHNWRDIGKHQCICVTQQEINRRHLFAGTTISLMKYLLVIQLHEDIRDVERRRAHGKVFLYFK